MLKLTRHLFEWSPSVATMDFYERALYNHILGSETAPGSMTYFVSLEPGHFKTHSTTNNSFWCCDGTGVENHSKYGGTIFFHGTNSLYLNLFIPSQLNWPDKGLTVVQNTAFPQSDTTTLAFQCTNGLSLTLNIRYPERFAQEALGHNSNAIHRAYARKAQVRLPSLESYEKQNTAGRIIPLLPPLPKPEGNGHSISAAG
jgi:hypothetical protein